MGPLYSVEAAKIDPIVFFFSWHQPIQFGLVVGEGVNHLVTSVLQDRLCILGSVQTVCWEIGLLVGNQASLLAHEQFTHVS